MSEIRSQATPARDELAEKWRADLTKVQGDELTIELRRRSASELLELLSPPKPRTVNSATELDALPIGSVVRVNDTNDAISYVCVRYSDGWFTTLHESMVYPLAVTGSVTVLFTPGNMG